MHYHSIDIFCHVVDNFGDIGFVFRFAREFHAANPLCKLRVFVDDLNAFHTIHQKIDPSKPVQTDGGIEYIGYHALTDGYIKDLEIADILIEAFACRIPEPIMNKAAAETTHPRVVINLEHLSAEPWVEEYHKKPSLLPLEHLKKYFYMPGLNERTGGVIVDHRIARIRPKLEHQRSRCIAGILSQAGYASAIPELENTLVGTVFTYERAFDTLLADLEVLPNPSLLLVFGEKSHKGMMGTADRLKGAQILNKGFVYRNVTALYVPFIPQTRYDTLLCCADFNIVRGEDSLVRALCAGRPFIWNAYLQDDKYQKVKVAALLDWMEPFFKGEQDVFKQYRVLHLNYNDAPPAVFAEGSGERYDHFFRSLTKIKHATGEMSYFLARNCDLVKQFSAFISSL